MSAIRGHTGSRLHQKPRWWLLWVTPPPPALALTHGAPSSDAQSRAQTDEDIVRQFYPERLTEESNEDSYEGDPALFQAYDLAVGDLEGTGSDDVIVAAYTNGVSGAIRVLRKHGSGASLVDEPDLPLLGSVFPYVELLNLDSDGMPRIIVSLRSARGRRW